MINLPHTKSLSGPRAAVGRCLAIAAACALMASCGSGPRYDGPLTPEASAASFRFADSLRADIFATEPLVIDPVSMEFDEQGNVFVVGMLDAYKPDSVKGRGCIVQLRDSNGDGRADTAVVFADSLREATSILPWEGGLLVAAAPNILFMKDTDGDGRADLREVLFTGFFNRNEEAQITNLRFGVDNWIYANNHGQAGEVSFSRGKDTGRLSMKGWDFRFRLDRNLFEATAGRGQYGLAMDDWGHRFYTQNAEHISQTVIQKKYLDRNPHLPKSARTALLNVSDHEAEMYQLTPAPWWRAERTRQRNRKFRENGLPETERAEDRFTGGSGGTFYEGELLPREYYGNIFTGDVAGNLVHRDVLRDIDSPYLKAGRGAREADREFMATTDSWVRPASFTTGPDGSLFMIDMYRQHIETPLSIPADLQVGMDFNAGDKYGRIYRIVHKGAPAYRWVQPDLRNASSARLMHLLGHRNQWWRLQAQRLLLERRDLSVIPEAERMSRTHPDARARLHALYVLEGLGALRPVHVNAAARDSAAGVREHAAILAERFPECLPALAALVKDASAQVAFQATLSIGDFKGPVAVEALRSALLAHGASPWYRTAVLTAPAAASTGFVEALRAGGGFFTDTAAWKRTFLHDLSSVIRDRGDAGEADRLRALLDGALRDAPATLKEGIRKGLSKDTAGRKAGS